MKKKTAFVLAIAVTVLSCAGYSSATVLGTIDYDHTANNLGNFSDMKFSIGYPIKIWDSGGHGLHTDLSTSLSWNITEADVGKTFFASAYTHEAFDDFVSFLTNGVDNPLNLADGHTIGSFLYAQPESVLISGIQDGVDFEEYTIDSIALTVNELFFDYNVGPGTKNYIDPGIKGGLPDIATATTHYSYDITYTINGTAIPEPTTVLLLGLGGLVLLRKRRR